MIRDGAFWGSFRVLCDIQSITGGRRIEFGIFGVFQSVIASFSHYMLLLAPVQTRSLHNSLSPVDPLFSLKAGIAPI